MPGRINMVRVPTKEAHVGVRTTHARKELWREYAAREGLRLSDWMRKLADSRVTASTRDHG
jgi:hypothetical protein